MGQTPGDDKSEPSLELPSLSLRGLGRGRRTHRTPEPATAPRGELPELPLEDPAPTTVTEAGPVTEPLPAQPEVSGEEVTDLAVPPVPGDRQRPTLSLPAVPGKVAASVTGLVVGMAGGLGTYGAIAGCTAVRGVGSCGGAPGFLILVAILALMVLCGLGLLKALRVSDPGSTSFLAVGVVTVVVMLVLLDVVFSPWMFVVVPLLSAAAFLLSHWVTTRFEDEPGRRDWA